jgi:hypothetical protein
MPVRIACPKCKKVHLLGDDRIGRPIRCDQCETAFKTGTPSRSSAPGPVPAAPPKSPSPMTSKASADVSAAVATKPKAQKAGGRVAGEEPSVTRAAPQSLRKGAPWIVVAAIAFVCFVVGGAMGFGVAKLFSSSSSPAKAPVVQLTAKER